MRLKWIKQKRTYCRSDSKGTCDWKRKSKKLKGFESPLSSTHQPTHSHQVTVISTLIGSRVISTLIGSPVYPLHRVTVISTIGSPVLSTLIGSPVLSTLIGSESYHSHRVTSPTSHRVTSPTPLSSGHQSYPLSSGHQSYPLSSVTSPIHLLVTSPTLSTWSERL